MIDFGTSELERSAASRFMVANEGRIRAIKPRRGADIDVGEEVVRSMIAFAAFVGVFGTSFGGISDVAELSCVKLLCSASSSLSSLSSCCSGKTK